MKHVSLYDTTLRDGCQAEDVSSTPQDKLRTAAKLTTVGIDDIEGGHPVQSARRPFFQAGEKGQAQECQCLSFGTTRNSVPSRRGYQSQRLSLRRGCACGDLGWQDLGPARARRAAHQPEEPIGIIADRSSSMKKHGNEVIFDAEHFFDGFRANPDYALGHISKPREGGADWSCLCETNGGTLPAMRSRSLAQVQPRHQAPIGHPQPQR